MKKIIVGLITFCAVTFVYGMEEQVGASQDTATAAQSVAFHLQNSFEKLVGIIDPLAYARRASERSRAIQRKIQEKKRAARTVAEEGNQIVMPQQKYSFSQFFKSARGATLVFWSIIRNIIVAPIHFFVENPPALQVYPHEYERASGDLKQKDNILKARRLFELQAEEEQTARSFQAKHTVALGALVTAICAGIASHNYGFNSKIAPITLGVGLVASVGSWFVFGTRARMNDIKSRRQTRILQLTDLHVSPQEADVAYTGITAGSLLNGIRLQGPFGLLAMRNMRNVVTRNFSLTTSVTEEPMGIELRIRSASASSE